jgi:ribosomal-protein-alanine acetyltransferase
LTTWLESVIIRAGTAADIPSMISLDRPCATSAHWSEDRYQQIFRDDRPGFENFVLLVEAGVTTTSISDEHPDSHLALLAFLVARHLTSEWELESIVVAPEAQRKGIGKKLLTALLARAKETNSESVFLEVRESNAAARKLYEKTGFERTGQRKSYYINPTEDAVLYRYAVR